MTKRQELYPAPPNRWDQRSASQMGTAASPQSPPSGDGIQAGHGRLPDSVVSVSKSIVAVRQQPVHCVPCMQSAVGVAAVVLACPAY